ncbi:MAG TPA: HEAT repeat domain-containing protein, partial [Terriglobales bacterium]|nr:HEAT repeat domain-containing protein [Terriglobales bacterium]
LLSRINIPLLLELLPHRLRDWTRYYHDAVVRQIAFGGSPERGRILLELLDMLDPMVLPEAVDEIGMSGDRTTAQHLIVMAAAGITEARSPLLQVKAIEALARLREPEAAPVLLRLVEDKKLFKYSHPRELRIAAAQALCKIDPEFGPALVNKRGINGTEMEIAPLDPSPQWPWNRYRRYERVVPVRTFPAVASSAWGKSNLIIRELSLGGGVARKEDTLRLGSEATLEVHSGMKNLRTQVMIRPVASTEVSFEIVDIDLEERSKLRRILADQLHRSQETALRAAAARA